MYRLLIIDDEPLIIDGLRNLLPWDNYGIEICGSAYNGETGLEKIRELNPDIVITDIRMPRKSGLELIADVRKIQSGTSFIILSGYEDFEYVRTGITLGVENYLLKPVNEKELAATISLTVQKIEKIRTNRLIQQEGISVLKDNVLYRWAQGLISSSELEERTELLGIPLANNNYSCGLLHCSDKSLKARVYEKCRRYIDESAFADSSGKLWSDTAEYLEKGDLILLFSGAAEQHGAFRKKIADQLLSVLDSSERESTVITLGKIENSPNMMDSSFRSALNLKKYSLLVPDKKILETEETLQSQEESEDIKKIKLSQMFLYIRNRDRQRLETFVSGFFQSLKKLNNPDDVQREVITLLLELDHFCELVKLDESILKHRQRNLIETILSADTMENLQQILMETLDRLMRILDKKESGQNPIIRKVLLFIEENIHDDVSLKRLGYEFNLNSNYLGQVFKKETGESYTNYVNNLRVRKASRMLEETSRSAAEIASAVGFLDPNYFYRVFRDIMNCTPTEYRNRFQEIL